MFSKSRFNPGPGFADFWSEFRKPNPYRWPILGVSVLPMLLTLWWATGETVLVPPAPPEVTYITSYAPDRTDDEIMESNIANQRRNDELRAQREEIEARKREMYRELGRATGIDVDAMEAEIEAERAREEAAARAARDNPEQTVADSAE